LDHRGFLGGIADIVILSRGTGIGKKPPTRLRGTGGPQFGREVARINRLKIVEFWGWGKQSVEGGSSLKAGGGPSSHLKKFHIGKGGKWGRGNDKQVVTPAL